MFASNYFPINYFPPNYWSKFGGGASVGAGITPLLLSQRAIALQAVADAEYEYNSRVARVRMAREAAAQLSFQMAMVQLRNLEADALRQLRIQRAVVTTVLAEV